MSDLAGWDRLKHEGLLLDAQRSREIAAFERAPLTAYYQRELRRRVGLMLNGTGDTAGFVTFVLTEVCGVDEAFGKWHRGPQVPTEWSRTAITGEVIKPRQLWLSERGGVLPVFIDGEKRVGVGRGKRAVSHVLQWLRAGPEQLALLTNGRQWRLVFAGLDFDAWCEWDVDLWLEEGQLSSQVDALRTLVQVDVWRPAEKGDTPRLLQAVLDSRKGQAELSQVLGERVREAVEILVQGHGEALKQLTEDVDPSDIYRAAVRMVMRVVVVLFAESRKLLPVDNQVYHEAYGVKGLLDELEKVAARGGNRLARSWSAWPRLLSLFRLVCHGSHHPELPVTAYGGELFARGDPDSPDALLRAVAVFERASLERETMSDQDVHRLLDRITRTRAKIRQGRSSTWVPMAVDFTDLSSEYIGILYEGLLEFELKTAPAGDPVVFLAVGNQPALPLSRLEAMDDKAIKNLLEKLKDNSSGIDDDATEGGEAEEAEREAPEEEEEEVVVDVEEQEAEEDEAPPEDECHALEGDQRLTTRTRAEEWARRAVDVGGLMRKPRGKLTPERKLAHDQAVGRKARQLVVRVVLPGEWYVVRWGGTRKGSGTFYTRPGLAVPTVQRTLRPLAWDAPLKDGKPDRDAPPAAWTPKSPEEILALKVVDPACGSGTFPVAALRFLTDTLYTSLHHHARLAGDVGRPLDEILGLEREVPDERRLGAVTLPCRPDDEGFEEQTRALLRRYVVERCIYGVDLDPLAVELCRLALWIETMDERLPFSFLDHKVKCGNALVGAWFDQFRHYPAMAWKNREGGDKGHTNGVHFEKESRTTAFKEFTQQTLQPDLVGHLVPHAWTGVPPDTTHDELLNTVQALHDMPVHEATERGKRYRTEFLDSDAWKQLRTAFDLWCACWFWPPEQTGRAALPSTIGDAPDETLHIVEQLRETLRFFHWELEFPDVFDGTRGGFDAVLGNPPWDIAKPNSKEFFSNIDPLYRSYGKQEALGKQTEYFAEDWIERDWLDYNAGFRAQSNYFKYAATPYGDPETAEKSQDRFALARGKQNQILHEQWRKARRGGVRYADPEHPYRRQGSADINLYKLFLERAYVLLRSGGRLGFVVPSGLYSDHGTGALRDLFIDRCRWEWLFGFENREKVFDIDSRFKFNPVVIEKGGRTEAIRTAFMRRKLEDWERGEAFATPYARAQITQFSPRSKAILEIQSARDLEILEKIYANSVLLGDEGPDGWGIMYSREFDMTNDSKLLISRARMEMRGLLSSNDDVRSLEVRQRLQRQGFLPVWEGKTCYFDDWIKQPEVFVAAVDAEGKIGGVFPSGVRRIARGTDARTLVTCIVPSDVPTTYTIEVSRSDDACSAVVSFALLSSYILDFVARMQVDESVPLSLLRTLPVPKRDTRTIARLANEQLRLLDPRVGPGGRIARRAAIDAVISIAYGLQELDLRHVLRACDHPVAELSARSSLTERLPSTSFWRVDKDRPPELRRTVLTLIASVQLEEHVRACSGDPEQGIEAFLGQNKGEGWILPDTLRLADYGLGHDDRAKHPQPVASRLGPRFYDWQLAQDTDESWRECHVHARNLLAKDGYKRLLEEIEAEKRGEKKLVRKVAEEGAEYGGQGKLEL